MLRPTVPRVVPADAAELPDDDDAAELAADASADDQAEGRGGASAESRPAAPKSRRRRRPAATGQLKARNVHLSDDVHDRLWMLARQRKQTVSAVLNDLLDKQLPRWEVKRVN